MKERKYMLQISGGIIGATWSISLYARSDRAARRIAQDRLRFSADPVAGAAARAWLWSEKEPGSEDFVLVAEWQLKTERRVELIRAPVSRGSIQ